MGSQHLAPSRVARRVEHVGGRGHDGVMRFEFTAPLWRWEARQELWTFVHLPREASEEIEEMADGVAGGFGSLRVTVTIGTSRWRTSIFPGGDGRYVLPIKAAVRRVEGLGLGDEARVALELVDL